MSTLDTIFAGPWGPLCIFLLRIGDVSLATLRILLSMRNVRLLVPLIGFFEVLIWIFAVGNAIRNLNSPLHLLGYAGGFATGNLVGLWLEEKLAIGMAVIRVVSRYGGVELAEALREKGFGVTEFAGQGRDGTVEIVDTVVRRREVGAVLREIDRWDPQAFVMIEEPRSIRHGRLLERPRERVPVPFGGLRTVGRPPAEEPRETAPGAAAAPTPEATLDPTSGASD
ncbi:MAG TPA: DUF2179 domain-containing protein [Longimicrobiales bacterium]